MSEAGGLGGKSLAPAQASGESCLPHHPSTSSRLEAGLVGHPFAHILSRVGARGGGVQKAAMMARRRGVKMSGLEGVEQRGALLLCRGTAGAGDGWRRAPEVTPHVGGQAPLGGEAAVEDTAHDGRVLVRRGEVHQHVGAAEALALAGALRTREELAGGERPGVRAAVSRDAGGGGGPGRRNRCSSCRWWALLETRGPTAARAPCRGPSPHGSSTPAVRKW